jgi:hypothetical protein
VLINVDVKSKPPLETIPEVKAIIRQVKKELAGKGRVLVSLFRDPAPVSGDGG